MQSIDLIRENLKKSRDRVLARVDPTPNGGCHTLWTLGHLAYIETLVIRTFMLGVRESTVALLDSLAEGDLDRVSAKVPEGFEDTFGTYRLCLQYVADHWHMHRGQLVDARRAAGLERMWL